MKKLSLLFGAAFLLLLGACTAPCDYNVSVMDKIAEVEKTVFNVTRLLEEKNFEAVRIAFPEGKERTKATLKKLESMSAFRDDDLLRQAAIQFVTFYDGLFSNEYQEAFDLLEKGESYTMTDLDVINNISERELEVRLHLQSEHIAFIKKYGLIAAGTE